MSFKLLTDINIHKLILNLFSLENWTTDRHIRIGASLNLDSTLSMNIYGVRGV